MDTLNLLLLVLQVTIAFTLIGLILIQHGKGADAGAAFGSAASTTVFGSQGSGSFLTKMTAVVAFVFLANSLLLGYLAVQRNQDQPETIMNSAQMMLEDTEAFDSDQDTQSDANSMGTMATMDEGSEIPEIPSDMVEMVDTAEMVETTDSPSTEKQ